MKRILMAAPIALAAGPGLAGSASEPVVETTPQAPAYTAPVGEWTGFYLGGQLGYGEADLPGPAGFDGGTYGVHAGYLHDIGDWVFGGELDYDGANMSFGPSEVDRIGRAKLIAGYDLGQHLIYGTVGAFDANIATPAIDRSDTGAFIGAGWKYKITENWIGGIEAIYHKKDDFAGFAGADFDATTITARVSYRF